MPTTKEALEQYFAHRPAATDEDIGYFVYVTDSIEHGLREAARGETVSHQDFKARVRIRWGIRSAT